MVSLFNGWLLDTPKKPTGNSRSAAAQILFDWQKPYTLPGRGCTHADRILSCAASLPGICIRGVLPPSMNPPGKTICGGESQSRKNLWINSRGLSVNTPSADIKYCIQDVHFCQVFAAAITVCPKGLRGFDFERLAVPHGGGMAQNAQMFFFMHHTRLAAGENRREPYKFHCACAILYTVRTQGSWRNVFRIASLCGHRGRHTAVRDVLPRRTHAGSPDRAYSRRCAGGFLCAAPPVGNGCF